MKDWHVCLIFIGLTMVLGFINGTYNEFGGFSGAGSYGVWGIIIGITGLLIYRTTIKRARKKSKLV